MKRLLLVAVAILPFLFTEAPRAAEPVKKQWTVMAFINGDNDLEKYFYTIRRRIEREGPSANVNVLVMYDGVANGDSELLQVRKATLDPATGKLVYESIPLQSGIEYDMGLPQTLARFVSFGIENYPAEHYALIVSGHGRGILNLPVNDGAKFGESVPTLAFSPDDSTGHYMDEEDMVRAIRNVLDKKNGGKKLDLFAYNSCLMGNLEVLLTLAPIADYALASEFTIKLFPGSNHMEAVYDTASKLGISLDVESMIRLLNQNPKTTARELGQVAVDLYKTSYEPGIIDYFSGDETTYPESTLALYDLRESEVLKTLVRTAISDFLAYAPKDPMALQRFYEALVRQHMVETVGYMDLGVMARIIYESSGLESAQRLQTYLESSNFIAHRTLLYTDKEVTGVSIFFTALSQDKEVLEEMLDFYTKIEVVKQTRSAELIRYFYYEYEKRDYEITMNLLSRYMAGENPVVRYNAADKAGNEHHLVRNTAWYQFYKDLQKLQFDRLREHVKLIQSGTRSSPVLDAYRGELRELLQKALVGAPAGPAAELKALLVALNAS